VPTARTADVPNIRAARRAVAAGLLLFAASQLALGVTAEYYPRLRDPLYGDKFAKLQRRLTDVTAAGPRPAVVVMLGSSRTGLAFHGKVMERRLAADLGRPAVAFNYGTPAAGPVTQLVYFDRLLAAGVRPDLLLVEVLPSMLADGHGGPGERHWFYADRLTSSERATVVHHGFDGRAVNARWRRSVLLPAYTLRFQIASRLAPSWLPWQVRFDWSRGSDECGWGTTQRQEVGDDQLGRGIDQARLEYAPTLADYHPGGPAAAALRELVGRCHAAGVPVRLVLMPEGSVFRRWLPPAGEARLTAFLANISTKSDVPVTDARTWLPDADFYDGHHMFARGAEAFTDRLGREVVAPILAAGPHH